MPKKLMPPKLRAALLLALSVALAASASAAVYVYYRLPAAATQPVPALDYRHEARIDYQVRLAPNGFYATGTLGPGQAYLAAFTQGIDVSLTYRFAAAEKVSLKGTSGVTATVEALTSERDQPLKVWERRFPLVPSKEFWHEGQTFELVERVAVDRAGYVQLVEALGKEAGVTFSEARLVVRWDVAAQVSSRLGTASETLQPTLVVPLNQKVFRIAGEPVAEKTGSFSELREVAFPSRQRLRYAALAVPPGLATTLLLVALWTQGRRISPAESFRRAVYKKYGAFLVEAAGQAGDPGQTVALATVDDLAKLADELGKPILHFESGEGGTGHVFCVLDGPVCYEFRLEDSTSSEIG